jgi:hypothetical protein
MDEAPPEDPAIPDEEPGAVVVPGVDGDVGLLGDGRAELLGEPR